MVTVQIRNGPTSVITAMLDPNTGRVTPPPALDIVTRTAWSQLFSIAGRSVVAQNGSMSWSGIWRTDGNNYKLENLREVQQ